MARIMYIDPSTKNANSLIKNLNKAIRSNNHVFLFLFMEGCGHCVRTKPEWKKIPGHFHHPHKDVVLAEVDQALFSKLHGVGKEPMGYPCFRYIHGSTIEDYENSDMANKDRTAASFSKWIEKKSHMKGGRTIADTGDAEIGVGGRSRKQRGRISGGQVNAAVRNNVFGEGAPSVRPDLAFTDTDFKAGDFVLDTGDVVQAGGRSQFGSDVQVANSPELLRTVRQVLPTGGSQRGIVYNGSGTESLFSSPLETNFKTMRDATHPLDLSSGLPQQHASRTTIGGFRKRKGGILVYVSLDPDTVLAGAGGRSRKRKGGGQIVDFAPGYIDQTGLAQSNPQANFVGSLINGGSRRRKKGGKWSLKYKQSINCRRPKGFSQKQHCKSRKLRNK